MVGGREESYLVKPGKVRFLGGNWGRKVEKGEALGRNVKKGGGQKTAGVAGGIWHIKGVRKDTWGRHTCCKDQNGGGRSRRWSGRN